MIDIDHLALQTAGDAALQRELLGLFLGQLIDLDTHLAALETAGCDKVDPGTSMILHRVRGAAAAMGAGEFAAVLADAEERWSQVIPAPHACETLRSATRTAIAEVSRLVVSAQEGGLAKAQESR